MSFIKFVVFVSFAFSAVSAVSECGVKPASSSFIVNGVDATENEFPWQGSFRLVNKTTGNNRHICGCNVINENWIITAAHCVDLYNNVAGIDETDFLVLLGEHSLGTPNPLKELLLKVIKIIVHSGWNSQEIKYDIAMVKVEKIDFVANPHIGPICLAELGHQIEGGDCVISGWGLTAYQGDTLPDILQKANVKCILQSECRSSLDWINKVSDDEICAGGGTTGVCNGDSGGPLQYVFDGKYHLAGATSWGVGCGWPGFPGVFTRVSSHKKFIADAMSAN